MDHPQIGIGRAALLARLLNHVTCNLRGTINLDETVYAWTDSRIVLCWLQTSVHTLEVFVANRVSQITGSETPLVWRHVPGEWNPADCASRGCRAPDLVSHPLWWGPQWLTESPQEWPFNECRAPLGPPDRGLRMNVGQLVPKPNPAFLLERYSSLDKLLRVTGWIKRFVNNCRKPQAERNFAPVLSPAERNAALCSLVRVVQAEHFEEEHPKNYTLDIHHANIVGRYYISQPTNQQMPADAFHHTEQLLLWSHFNISYSLVGLLLVHLVVYIRTLEPYDLEEQLYKELQLRNPSLDQEDINNILKERQKLSFTSIIQEILTRDVSQPILKISKKEEPSPKESLEFLTQATLKLRGEYLSRQQRALDAIARKVNALRTLSKQHGNWIKDLQADIDDVTLTSTVLKEKCALAEKHQDDIKYRCSAVIRNLRASSSATPAERALLSELERYKKSGERFEEQIRALKKHANEKNEELKKWEAEYKRKDIALGKSHSDTISSILQQQTSQISTLIEETKLLKDQLSIV
ncbi:nuclear pore component domain-containing protein [Phthorimaea operculella]|nr:nuclear pore component domain-containing protein [Phthorimaea operculella]